MLNHILLVNPEIFKVVNIEFFQKATQLKNEINERSSIGAMKYLPFCYMIQATNSPKLNREQRLNLLANSVRNSGPHDMFTHLLCNNGDFLISLRFTRK